MRLKKITLILTFLRICQSSGQVNLYLENEIPISGFDITASAISHNSRFLACGDENGTVFLWDIQAKKPLYKLNFHEDAVRCLAFDSKNQTLFSGAEDGRIAVWDLYSGQVSKSIRIPDGTVCHMGVSPDDILLAAAGKTRIHLVEPSSGRLAGTLAGHEKEILLVAFHAGGGQILSVDKGGLMVLWNAGNQRQIRATRAEPYTMKNSGLALLAADCSCDRYVIALGIEERVLAKGGTGMVFRYNLSLYDWNSASEITTLPNHHAADVFVITPDKKYVVMKNSTLRQRQFSFLNIDQGTIEKNVPVGGDIQTITVSEDGRLLAIAVTVEEPVRRSFQQVWTLSGVGGFERFPVSGRADLTLQASGLGPVLSFTTSREPLISGGEKKRIAVLDLEGPGLGADIAKTATYLLESKLGNSNFVELVERNRIDRILDELRYQQSGLTTSNVVEIGRHLNAQYMMMGSINRLGNIVILTAKLVNVETSAIEGTREVQCRNATVETIPDMVSALVPAIVKSQ
jgi:WD40 repeat protein